MIGREFQFLVARIKGRSVLKISNLGLSPQFRVGSRLEATKILLDDSNKALLEGFLTEVKPGDIVFDIGANIGQYSIPAALRAGSSGEVHAFEPAPIWARRLQENIKLNNLSNVTTHRVGLSDRGEQRLFVFKNRQGSGMGSVVENYTSSIDAKKLERIQIDMETGDRYLARYHLPPPHIAKIDVEGAELEVLRGFEEALKDDRCRFLFCEVHPDFLEEPMKEVEETLENYGFEIEIKESLGPPHLFHIFAKKSL